MGEGAWPLFVTEGTAALPDHPALIGGHCRACGNIYFPMQAYGCDRCGSTDVSKQHLTGRGRLVSSAPVHISMNPAYPAPYVVGSIATDDGAVVRAVLDVAPDADLALGTLLVTALVKDERSEDGEPSLRFRPAGQEN